MAVPSGANTPDVHGICEGIGPGQIFSSTAHGQTLRGERRIACEGRSSAQADGSGGWISGRARSEE
eukprot:CAMPEP_0181224148 /NCGR_PEP_ID=MMETSP1096-20121128/30954_1 /TAXON_ID=156174 ORGANISM="Chrysochromulina ericina, Strain CCMP281" /NCGR_SAMPLE_ID=MMETSP1096 /ASSEMBLY_ACC=CAM_ASM_000453 /LENGTH=65 /DNA_ID=CAMNT_0023317175 /DNA_START=270 /DNA_END=467 /DNA_ORIENTATION=+